MGGSNDASSAPACGIRAPFRRQADETRADPFTWAELVPQLLQTAGWPGTRPLTSAEFQALRRWQQALDECASLGFNGRRMSWREFLQALVRALDETLFAPESRDAPIQITGPAESAGLFADAIWFLGAAEDSWPATGATHPLLPFEIQRQAEMPHTSPQLDWDLAHSLTTRLLASAAEVRFSYARQSEGVEMRPSRLIAQVAGPPQPLPAEDSPPPEPAPVVVAFPDSSRVPLSARTAPGGSGVLTAQSQCAFKAFATARLAAQGWEPAQGGLTAAQRGQVLHAVLHSIWAGPPDGIRSHKDLLAIADLRTFVEGHARNALRTTLPATVRERMPQRYIELEEARLVDLVGEWLAFEATRAPFVVAGAEVDVNPSIAGLALQLRLDRVDRLADGSLLVIDYKSGDVSPAAWELPRPDDVQLPLYAGFGLDENLRAQLAGRSRAVAAANGDAESEGRLGGLAFAKVRAGEHCFEGRVGDASRLLLPNLHASSALVKRKFYCRRAPGVARVHRKDGARFSCRPRQCRSAPISANLRALRFAAPSAALKRTRRKPMRSKAKRTAMSNALPKALASGSGSNASARSMPAVRFWWKRRPARARPTCSRAGFSVVD